MNEFFFQGGYGFYVWSAYAVSFISIALIVAATLSGWRKAKRALAALQDSETNL